MQVKMIREISLLDKNDKIVIILYQNVPVS